MLLPEETTQNGVEPEQVTEPPQSMDAVQAEDLLGPDEAPREAFTMEDAKLRAVLEAIVYITDQPLSLEQICTAIEQPRDRVIDMLEQLTAEYDKPERGLTIREVAGGFQMATKPEHHEEVRRFVKNLNPPLKLSLAALETLAVIAYKQPITAPEIMEIRGVQGAGVLKTLVDRKLIATAGRKQVLGKPILYKTTREFLVQFGLKDVSELPTLKEFQDLARFDTESQPEPVASETAPEPVPEPAPDVVPVSEPEPAPEPVHEPVPEELPESEPETGVV